MNASSAGFTTARGVRTLIRELSTIKDAPPSERSLRAANVGERLERLCSSADVLSKASHEIVSIARRERCNSLLGASPLGERLAGAAVAYAKNGLQIWNSTSPDENVLIIDGLMVTGAQIGDAIRRARSEGATHAIAAVLMAAPIRQAETDGQTKLIVLADQS